MCVFKISRIFIRYFLKFFKKFFKNFAETRSYFVWNLQHETNEIFIESTRINNKFSHRVLDVHYTFELLRKDFLVNYPCKKRKNLQTTRWSQHLCKFVYCFKFFKQFFADENDEKSVGKFPRFNSQIVDLEKKIQKALETSNKAYCFLFK